MRCLYPILFIFCSVCYGCKKADNNKKPVDHTLIESATKTKSDIFNTWAAVSFQLTAKETTKPIAQPAVTSKNLGLVWTAVYDAWSRYDTTATTVYLMGIARRPETEWTEKNKEIAISYAAYSTLKEFYPTDSAILNSQMNTLGFDSNNKSLSPLTAIGIGNLAAEAVINTNNAGKKDEGRSAK